MRILVTGGSGFIGSNLVDCLINMNHETIVIDNLSTGLKENHNHSAKYFDLDLINFSDIKKLIVSLHSEKTIDCVFHLAADADVRKSVERPDLTFANNSTVTYLLSELCGSLSISKFVFTSTSAVYGEPQYLPVNESYPINPISPYGLSKYFAERSLILNSNFYKTDTIIFRLPNVYGYRQRSDLEGGVVAIFKEAMDNDKDIKFFGDGSQTRDWVNVNDIVNAFVLSMELNNIGAVTFNLGSERKYKLYELFDLMKTKFRWSGTPKFCPPRKGDIKDMVLTNSKAEKELNWKPKISLGKGIELL